MSNASTRAAGRPASTPAVLVTRTLWRSSQTVKRLWPDRAADLLPPDRLDVALSLAPRLKREFRHGRITGYGSFAARADRIAATRQFIAESGYRDARLEPLGNMNEEEIAEWTKGIEIDGHK